MHRQIKNFEASLSVRLLEKVKRNIVPTKAGLRLCRHAERILDERRAIAEYLKKPPGEVAAVIRLAAPPLLAEVFLTTAIQNLLAENVNVSIECLLGNDILHLGENEIDVAVRIGRLSQVGQEGYKTVLIGEVTRVLVASSQYLQKNGKPGGVHDLKKHRILHFGSLTELKRARWNLPKTIELTPILSASSPQLILDAALKGHGIALLPEMLCARQLQQKKLIEVLPESRIANIPISVCVRNGYSENSVVSDFLGKIHDAAKSARS